MRRLIGPPDRSAVDAQPLTAVVTVFRHGEAISSKVRMLSQRTWDELRGLYSESPQDDRAARYARLKARDDEGKTPSLADLERDYICDPPREIAFACVNWERDRRTFVETLKAFTARNDPRHYLVDEITIHAPGPLLRDGIELIDTPGLDDPDRYRAHITDPRPPRNAAHRLSGGEGSTGQTRRGERAEASARLK